MIETLIIGGLLGAGALTSGALGAKVVESEPPGVPPAPPALPKVPETEAQEGISLLGSLGVVGAIAAVTFGIKDAISAEREASNRAKMRERFRAWIALHENDVDRLGIDGALHLFLSTRKDEAWARGRHVQDMLLTGVIGTTIPFAGVPPSPFKTRILAREAQTLEAQTLEVQTLEVQTPLLKMISRSWGW